VLVIVLLLDSFRFYCAMLVHAERSYIT